VVTGLLKAELDPADASKESGNRELPSFGFWSRGLEHVLRG
jgi:hypothetical protein